MMTGTAAKLTNEEIKRYSRHLIMPELGMEGQLKLKASSVLIIGAGGLGCPLAMYLAAAGIGKMGIVDFDTVDYSNLHRQVLFSEGDVGKYKAEVAQRRVNEINPNVEVKIYKEPFKSYNALEISKEYDILIDGTDNFPTRYLVNDVAVLTKKVNVFGSIFRFDGQVTVFDAAHGPCYRCLYPEPPEPGMVPNCAEGGVLGILPGIVGIMQATEAIKVIAGIGEPLIGRLSVFDALQMKFRELKIKKDPHCALCGPNPTVTQLIDYEQFCGVAVVPAVAATPASIVEIAPKEFKKLYDAQKQDIYLLDVREPYELDISFIEGSVGIPLKTVAARANEIPRDKDVVVICRTGNRSKTAILELQQLGFNRLKNLTGGINRYADEVDDSLPIY